MRQTLNKIYSGIGLLIFMVGFVMCIKAAGMADLGDDLSLLARYSYCGLITCLTGLFIHRWRV